MCIIKQASLLLVRVLYFASKRVDVLYQYLFKKLTKCMFFFFFKKKGYSFFSKTFFFVVLTVQIEKKKRIKNINNLPRFFFLKIFFYPTPVVQTVAFGLNRLIPRDVKLWAKLWPPFLSVSPSYPHLCHQRSSSIFHRLCCFSMQPQSFPIEIWDIITLSWDLCNYKLHCAPITYKSALIMVPCVISHFSQKDCLALNPI